MSNSATPRAGRGFDETRSVIILCVLGLLAIGVLMIYSASSYLSIQQSADPLWLFRKHLIFVVASVVTLCAFSMFNYQRLLEPRTLWAMVGVTVALLLLVLVCPPINGARRWIRVGSISFQPSELAKLVAILFFADFLTRRQDKVRTFQHGFLPSVLIAGGLCALIVAERDLGTPVLLFCVLSAVMLAGGVHHAYILIMAGGGASAVYLLIRLFQFRMERIWAFLDPWQYPETAGYQVIQSMVAIHAGGPTGVGLGLGLQKHGFLPAHTSDFIFALIGEELGAIGCGIVVVLCGLLLAGGLKVIRNAPDLRSALVAVGIVTSIGLQAIIHMGVVTCLFPTKGIALPFVSAGGSSMLLAAAGVGILLNIASQSRPAEAEVPQGGLVAS